MQFSKSALFVAVAVAASFVTAAPSSPNKCLGLVQGCTTNRECCSGECIASVSTNTQLSTCNRKTDRRFSHVALRLSTVSKITGIGYHYKNFLQALVNYLNKDIIEP
ncbi:hypothetical protein FIBSPDRAFT_892503 [Athelia psychrophila]|uniref:Hydrophobin n=1 Tax=Athelia psychrophila TaxID=1759441 RepID=A0A166IEU6_9AGAM|nr:hypothetical protein FIBSPDRAFT_892503 [Fibularhizoctonia sp. CBS 109695]